MKAMQITACTVDVVLGSQQLTPCLGDGTRGDAPWVRGKLGGDLHLLTRDKKYVFLHTLFVRCLYTHCLCTVNLGLNRGHIRG